jgi:5'-nucleotidase
MNTENKPLLLISNDDGYHAKGLKSLIAMVRHLGEIIVVAPESARSGFSSAFSATTPLRLKLRRQEEGVSIYSCNGTPVDCVKLALSEICPRRPDIVIGGINHGDNASVNTHYSGTVGHFFSVITPSMTTSSVNRLPGMTSEPSGRKSFCSKVVCFVLPGP